MALDRVLKLWQAAKRSWGVKLVEVVEKLLRIVVGRFVSRHDATRQTSDKLCCRVAIGIATNQVEYFPLFCVHQVEGTSVVPVMYMSYCPVSDGRWDLWMSCHSSYPDHFWSNIIINCDLKSANYCRNIEQRYIGTTGAPVRRHRKHAFHIDSQP